MPRIKLTIEVVVSDEDTNNGELIALLESQDMSLLVRDALGEFCARRGCISMETPNSIMRIRDYVDGRYDAWPPSRRDAKVAEVFNRCWLASTLKQGDVNVEVYR